MFYEFPHINDLSEVLEAVKGRDEFVVKRDEANRLVIVNYAVNFEDTFPPVTDRRTALLRECRGITFDMDSGRVIARKFHKFFNLNERAETLVERVDFTQPHRILDKLDGSMLSPLVLQDSVRWATKMGLTPVAEPVERYVSAVDAGLSQGYDLFARMCWINGWTPLFEWCSRQQRIVIDYAEERLVLLAVRENITGAYFTYSELEEFSTMWDIPLVRAEPGGVDSIEQFMQEARDLEGAEGYIVRFDSGHMLKVKGSWYCQLHKTLDQLRFEKDVIRLILDEKLDDAKPFLPAELVACADAFGKDLFANMRTKGEQLFWIAQVAHDNFNGSKKRFAIEVVNAGKFGKDEPGLLFSIWDRLEQGEAGAAQLVRDAVGSSVGSQGKVNAARHLFGGINWHTYIGNKVPTDD